MKALLIYVVGIGAVTFLLFGIDKFRARRNWWRIPESVLLLFAFAGGAVGALLGMLAFRHKTQHAKFVILVPLFIVLHAVLVYFLIKNNIIFID